MMDENYCIEELQKAKRLRYRAQCQVRCLEANLDRIDPEDFEPLMASLETARRELMDAGYREIRARMALIDCKKKLSDMNITEQP